MAKKKSSKKSSLQQYAPIGLWVAGAAIVSAGLALARIFLSYVQISVIQNQDAVNLWLWISLGLIVIGPAIYALLNPKRIREIITGRQARYGSNALIMLVAFVGILVVVNAIAFQNPKQWDLTEDKIHTLAPETLDTLDALPSPVTAYCFFTSRSMSMAESTRDLLEDYRSNSDGKFNYEFIDPEADPVTSQRLGVTRDRSIVLVMEERNELISYATETEVTNALVRLMNPGQRTVYFLIGHGEHDIQGSDETAYSRLRTVLESKNYIVRTLNLLAQNQVPEDALAVIIAGPLNPVGPEEVDILVGYLASGGSLVVLSEPPFLTETGLAPDPLVDHLASRYGILLSNDLVIDQATNRPLYAVAAAYGSHPITEKLNNETTFYYTARSIIQLPGDAPATLVQLVQTTDRSWGETDMSLFSSGQAEFNGGVDTPGPLTLAIAVDDSTSGARIVVFGDSDFASDLFFDQYANGDMIVNAIDWAAEQEGMINLTTISTPSERMLILPSNITQLLIGISFLCIIPGLVVAGGVAAWFVRRIRG
ncbi:MAG: GldG family protein [Chloroflexota bacterium]